MQKAMQEYPLSKAVTQRRRGSSNRRMLSRGGWAVMLGIVLSSLGFYVVIVMAATPTVKVELVSQPPGAEIWLNGKKHSSPAPATLNIGRDATLSLELRQKGYQTRIWRDEQRLRQSSSVTTLHLYLVMAPEVEAVAVVPKPTPVPVTPNGNNIGPGGSGGTGNIKPPQPLPGYCGFDFPRSEAVAKAPTLPSFTLHDRLRQCVTREHFSDLGSVAALDDSIAITQSQAARSAAQGDVLVDLAQLYHDRGGVEGYQSCLSALGQAAKKGIPTGCKRLRGMLLKLNCSQKYQARTASRPPPGLFPDVRSGAQELLNELDNVEQDMNGKESHACWVEVKKDVVTLLGGK